MADIEIAGSSGFYVITGLSQAGQDWINDNVQGAEDGVAYCDDQRLLTGIAVGAGIDGLLVA